MSITQPMLDMMESLFKQGKSASQISAALCAHFPAHPLSRNAVIGHCHRRGWTRSLVPRPKPGPSSRPKRIRRPPQIVAAPAPLPPPVQRRPSPPPSPDQVAFQTGETFRFDKSKAYAALPGIEPIDLMDLSIDTCRWPIGENPVRYCGCHTDDGRSFCKTHRKMAYQPKAERSEKTRTSGSDTRRIGMSSLAG